MRSSLGTLVSQGFPFTRHTVSLLFYRRLIPLILAAMEEKLPSLGKLKPWLGYYVSERVIEYTFVVRNLIGSVSRVLDVGCCESLFTHYLIGKGYDTYALDIRLCPEIHPKVRFCQANSWDTPFEDDYFGVIVVVSTIEHIGLGGYGGPRDKGGDLMTMKELKRILRDDGRILMTLPLGSKYSVGWERIYDEKRLSKLIEGLTIVYDEVWLRNSNRWIRTRMDQLRSALDEDRECIACMVLTKR